MSFAFACAGSSAIIASASAFTIVHGCTWTCTSKIFMGRGCAVARSRGCSERERCVTARPRNRATASYQHHQTHADRGVGTGALKFARAEELRMHFIAIDRLESPLPKVLFGRRRPKIKLAQPARRETVQ